MDQPISSQIVKLASRDRLSSISVDPVNKVLFYSHIQYWIFIKTTSIISKANMDGTGKVVLKKDGMHISAIANDPWKKVLYFVDLSLKNIQQINYDGTNQRVVIAGDSFLIRPISISIFQSYAYIVNQGSATAVQCKLYGDLECKSFDLNVLNAARVMVVQESQQKQVSNMCDGHKCEIVCVQAELGPKCLCSNGTFTRSGKCDEVCF